MGPRCLGILRCAIHEDQVADRPVKTRVAKGAILLSLAFLVIVVSIAGIAEQEAIKVFADWTMNLGYRLPRNSTPALF